MTRVTSTRHPHFLYLNARVWEQSEEFIESCSMCKKFCFPCFFRAFLVYDVCLGKELLLMPWRFALEKKSLFVQVLSLGKVIEWIENENEWINPSKSCSHHSNLFFNSIIVVALYITFSATSKVGFVSTMVFIAVVVVRLVLFKMCFIPWFIRMKFHIESQIEKHKFWRSFIGSNFKSHLFTGISRWSSVDTIPCCVSTKTSFFCQFKKNAIQSNTT